MAFIFPFLDGVASFFALPGSALLVLDSTELSYQDLFVPDPAVFTLP